MIMMFWKVTNDAAYHLRTVVRPGCTGAPDTRRLMIESMESTRNFQFRPVRLRKFGEIAPFSAKTVASILHSCTILLQSNIYARLHKFS
jgi:hypothetical protein